MKTISYRVRPVTRFNLTRGESDPTTGSGGVGSVGEFDNPQAAEEVGRALAAQTEGATFYPLDGEIEYTPYRQYVIVERGFDVDAKAFYAEYPQQAQEYKQQLEAHYGREFRVFSRETDWRAPRPDGWLPLTLTK